MLTDPFALAPVGADGAATEDPALMGAYSPVDGRSAEMEALLGMLPGVAEEMSGAFNPSTVGLGLGLEEDQWPWGESDVLSGGRGVGVF